MVASAATVPVKVPAKIVEVLSWLAVAPEAAPDTTVEAVVSPIVALAPTVPVKVPARIVDVLSWFAVAPEAAPLTTVEAAVPLMLPVTFAVTLPLESIELFALVAPCEILAAVTPPISPVKVPPNIVAVLS